jgi:hypothetical protein
VLVIAIVPMNVSYRIHRPADRANHRPTRAAPCSRISTASLPAADHAMPRLWTPAVFWAIALCLTPWCPSLRAADDAVVNPFRVKEFLPSERSPDTPPAPPEMTATAISTDIAADSEVSWPDAVGDIGTEKTVGYLQDAACLSCPGVSSQGGYCWQIMPQGLIYRSYLAGAKESRIRGVWHDETNDGDIWDVSLGGHVGLLRYGTTGNGRPQGFQLGIEGAGLVRLDLDENMDVTATDYRFGIPLTWGDTLSQWKFAFYHLSSHVGDEFLLKNPGFPRLNYSRDVLVLGHSHYFNDWWRCYAEVGYGVNTDVSEPWEVQFGIEYAPLYGTGTRGAPFVAFNGHLREEVDFSGNFVAQAGWAWRRSAASGLLRTGVEYYNGKSDQFSFFDDSEQKVGFGIWYDY